MLNTIFLGIKYRSVCDWDPFFIKHRGGFVIRSDLVNIDILERIVKERDRFPAEIRRRQIKGHLED